MPDAGCRGRNPSTQHPASLVINKVYAFVKIINFAGVIASAMMRESSGIVELYRRPETIKSEGEVAQPGQVARFSPLSPRQEQRNLDRLRYIF